MPVAVICTVRSSRPRNWEFRGAALAVAAALLIGGPDSAFEVVAVTKPVTSACCAF
jgi:hypothetical protein